MIRLIVGFFFFSFFLFVAQVSAFSSPEEAYTSFYQKIQKNYSLTKQDEILDSVAKRLEWIIAEAPISQRPALQEVMAYNAEKIFEHWMEKQENDATQILKEKREILSFSKEISPPSFLSKAISQGISIYQENEAHEILRDWEIERVVYTKYFPLSAANIDGFSLKNGIILWTPSGEYRFVESYSFEKKIPMSELSQIFPVFLTSEKKFDGVEGVYMGYYFDTYGFFSDEYGVYLSQLEAQWFSPQTTLLYKDANGRYNFVKNFTSQRIISQDILWWLPNKASVLQYLREDAELWNISVEQTWKSLQKQAASFQSADLEKRSAEIYAWILEHIQYSQNIDLNDKKIFSALHTYLYNDGVCTGYSKLFVYLLSLSWISDAEVIRWHVIDAPDFPDIGHAWVRVGEKYYDPTFDDPVWASSTKTPEQYLYFWLPRDIFYANRFHYDDLPESFKTATQSQIEQHIFNTLSWLISRYRDEIEKYKVFLPVVFRNTYNIPSNQALTPELLAEKHGYFTVSSDSFSYKDAGKTRTITFLRYYSITPENTSSVLSQLEYDLSNTTLFYWEKTPWIWEWRLAYELTTR